MVVHGIEHLARDDRPHALDHPFASGIGVSAGEGHSGERYWRPRSESWCNSVGATSMPSLPPASFRNAVAVLCPKPRDPKFAAPVSLPSEIGALCSTAASCTKGAAPCVDHREFPYGPCYATAKAGDPAGLARGDATALAEERTVGSERKFQCREPCQTNARLPGTRPRMF